MKKKNWTEHKKIKKLYDNMNEEFFIENIEKWINDGYSFSKVHRHTETLVDIVRNFGYEKALCVFDEYKKTKSMREKLRIRYGNERVEEFKEKLSKRKRPKVLTCFNKKYWLLKGYTEEESIDKLREIQKKSYNKRKKQSYRQNKKKLKWCIEYWTEKGYTEEEADIIRREYISYNNLEGFIGRHGPKLGEEKYFKYIEKYKKSMKNNMANKKQAGYVSKEGKMFFVKVYKILRKLGIERKDIYFGIDGSREFFFRLDQKENEGRFVDFCIPKLKLCVEYNGTFWHAREREKWKNPFIEYEISQMKDEQLKNLCEEKGFKLIVVWSDDNLEKRIEEIRNEVWKTLNTNST